MLVAFGIGALNTSFVKDGEVSVPLSYVTGTLVKMGQGIERHIAGGNLSDWLGYFLLFASFVFGATVGGVHQPVRQRHRDAGVRLASMCALTTGYTYFHSDRRALLNSAGEAYERTSAAALAGALLPMLACRVQVRLCRLAVRGGVAASASAGCRASWQPAAGSSTATQCVPLGGKLNTPLRPPAAA